MNAVAFELIQIQIEYNCNAWKTAADRIWFCAIQWRLSIIIDLGFQLITRWNLEETLLFAPIYFIIYFERNIFRISSLPPHWLYKVLNYGHTELMRSLCFIHFSLIFLLWTFIYHCLCLGFWKATLTEPSHIIHSCFGPLTVYDNLFTNSLPFFIQSILFWTLIKWIQPERLIDISSSYISCFTLAATTELLFMLNIAH